MANEAEPPDVPEAVLWHEGMLLAPQHLQQHAAGVDRSLRFRTAATDAYNFGVVALDIDHSALVSGLFRVTRVRAIMPDGLIVQTPAPDDAPLELDISEYADRLRVQALRIELIVPREAGRGEQPNSERFRSFAGNEELDTTGGGNVVTVPRHVPNADLRVADRPTTKFTALPLAEVVLRDEAFVLTDYVAPRLRLTAEHPLNRELSALARRLREKAVYVSERARSHRSRSAHEAAEALRLPLMALSQNLPEIEAQLSSGNVHPFSLYLVLCRLAGSVTMLTNFAVPPQGRGYRHDDIRRSYRHLTEFISGCLDQIRQEFTVVPFEQIDGGFQLDLKTQPPQRELTVAAQVAPGLSADATWTWLVESLIAAPERMDDLRRRRILGAQRRLLSRDEAISYTLAGDTVLFAVTLDEGHVGPDDTICVVNTAPEKSEVRPVQLYAYLAPESADSGSGASR